MNEKELVNQAVKKVKVIIGVSLIVLICISFVFHMIGQQDKENRIKDIEDRISYNTYSYEEKMEYSSYNYKLYFNKKNDTGSLDFSLTSMYSDPIYNEFEFTYKGTIDFWGMEYIEVQYDENEEIEKYRVGRNNKDTIVALKYDGDIYNAIKNNKSSISYKNEVLRDIFVMLLVIALGAVIYAIVNIFLIKRRCKIEAEQKVEEIKKEQIRLNRVRLQNEWEEQVEKLGYSCSAIQVSYGNWIWVENNIFYEAEKANRYIERYLNSNEENHEVMVEMISVKDIQYFSKEGDVQYTTKISGGGGGGSSIGGAIVGGLLAGEAGAIIGSRKQANEITTETVKHDGRSTLIRYYKGGQVLTINYIGIEVYDYLLKMIPEKDLLTQQLKSKQIPDNDTSQVNSDSIEEKLISIKKLHEKGLITEEEYNKKKNEILKYI